MSKGNSFENALLALIFNGSSIANLADDASSSPLTSLYVSLHTSDPGEAGAQNTNEADYTSYARVAVPRDNTGWTVSGNAVTNADAIVFPEASGGSNTITHFAVGTASSGAGMILYKGQLTTPINVSTGIEPRFEAGELDISED